MNIITAFDPSAATTGEFNMVFPGGRGKMLVFNESNINLQLTFANGYTSYVPAWTANLYCLNGLSSPLVVWTQYSTLTSSGAPISQVVIEGFDPNEPVPGTYPAALVRQTNIGNSVTTNVGSTTSLKNDGNLPGTSIIEATPSDAGTSTWSADNSGNLLIKGDNAGVLTTLLQLIAGASPAVKLAAAAVLTEALGNMKVDGTFESVGAATLDSTLSVTGAATLSSATLSSTLSVTGATTVNNITINGNITLSGTLNSLQITGSLRVNGITLLDNGAIQTDGSGNMLFGGTLGVGSAGNVLDASSSVDTYLKTRTAGGNINFQNPNGTTRVSVGSGGLIFQTGTGIQWKSGDTLSITHKFTGSGSGTYSHGATAAPFIILVIDTSSGGSMTVGVSGITSTQCTVTCGAAHAFSALCLVG